MTTTATLAKTEQLSSDVLEQVLVDGNLDKLSPENRLIYYQRVCESVGLNPLTKPFQYIKLNGKLTLYATKDATDQIRQRQQVSIVEMISDFVNGDLYRVQVKAQDGSGRSEISSGVLSIKGLQGEALANAMMKAETKAKRRVTLSLCGLGMLDESEIETIPAHAITEVEPDTGQERPQPPQARPKPPTQQEAPANDDAATERQIKAIFAIANSVGFEGADEIKRYVSNLIGVEIEHSNELTKAQASDVIKALQEFQ